MPETSNLRITAGTLKGRRLAIPRKDVRPTSERARQAYFNIIGERIRGAHFLDLFAGSGAFAFEAVSRGAASAIAVDDSRSNIAEIESRAREWNAAVKGVVADAIGFRPTEPIDLVYADPPYDFARYDELLRTIDTIHPALAAIEHRRKQEPFTAQPLHLVQTRRAEYGEVWITFFGRTGE